MDQFEGHEDQKQVEEIQPSHDSLNNTNSTQPQMPSPPHPQQQQQQQLVQYNTWNNKPKYKECLKNHAVGIGGHAVDGCGEFMPAGEDGSLDSLKCAACNCHRNFHRKIPTTPPAEHFVYHPSYYRTLPPPCGYLHHVAPQQRPLALPSTSGGGGYREDLEDMSNPSNSGGSGSSKKRFRTKFSPEQKERMLALADKLGWRIQREDEELVQQFCNETGVRRQVFKVWMHNNKHTLGKKP